MTRMAAAVLDICVRIRGAARRGGDRGAGQSGVRHRASLHRRRPHRRGGGARAAASAEGSWSPSSRASWSAAIYIEVRGARGYFGMLSVDPARQKAGIGRILVDSAEAHFRAAGCQAVDIKIVHLRSELPPYYRALGYVETGTAPFVDDNLKQEAHFVIMSKPL